MAESPWQDRQDATEWQLPATAPAIGRIAKSNSSGQIFVTCGSGEIKAARLLAGLQRSDLQREDAIGREALLVFENGDPDRPIIVGLLQDPLTEFLAFENGREENERREINLDSKRLIFQAEDEILLKCGKGSILLRKDGKIIIKGAHLLSRASGSNRIKGASVNIN